MNEIFLYFIAKMISLISCTAVLLMEAGEAGSLMTRLLAFSCLFLTQLLTGLLKHGKYKKWIWISMLLQGLACFQFGIDRLFPLLILLIWEWIELLTKQQMFYQLALVGTALLCLLYPPSPMYALMIVGNGGFFFLARELNNRILRQNEILYRQKEDLTAAGKKLEDMKAYTKTVRDTVAMEERNRFGARIHDQLGHNISGSIILLEAVLMSMEGDIKGARKNIVKVVENLRGGVDEIRLALRQERPDRSRLGSAEVREQLEAFQITYGIETRLEVQGEMDKISIPIWICIQDNLKEAMTNMLKHSNGNNFLLKITVMNRILRVEYRDNGQVSGETVYGLGLGSMEERTAACGGKCMIHGGKNGFLITTVFIL